MTSTVNVTLCTTTVPTCESDEHVKKFSPVAFHRWNLFLFAYFYNASLLNWRAEYRWTWETLLELDEVRRPNVLKNWSACQRNSCAATNFHLSCTNEEWARKGDGLFVRSFVTLFMSPASFQTKSILCSFLLPGLVLKAASLDFRR